MNIFPPPKFSSKAEWLAKTIHHLAPLLNQASTLTPQSFQHDHILRFHTEDECYSYTHYRFCFPDLPEPLDYLNINVVLGTAGFLCFDQNDLSGNEPRKNATLCCSSGLSEHHHLKAYLLDHQQVILTHDKILMGQELLIQGSYPYFVVKGEFPNMQFELKLHISKQASWYAKTMVYDHLSLLMQYEGQISTDGEVRSISGLGSFEFARSATPHSLYSQHLEILDKLPIHFATHQVINLDDQTQLLLDRVDLAGKPLLYCAHIRHSGGFCETYSDVAFNIIKYQQHPTLSPFGQYTLLPEQFEWLIYDNNGDVHLKLMAEIHENPKFGHGLGYSAGFSYQGEYAGALISGKGYLEYVDVVDQNEILEKFCIESSQGLLTPPSTQTSSTIIH